MSDGVLKEAMRVQQEAAERALACAGQVDATRARIEQSMIDCESRDTVILAWKLGRHDVLARADLIES